MGLRQELENKVDNTFGSQWKFVEARVVPDAKNIGAGNIGKRITATVMYADLDSSTALVAGYKDWFAAEVYKSFLYCASRLIRGEGGEIRSFDGDRVMGVFTGDTPNTDAVKAALKLNWAVKNIVNPKIAARYSTPYVVKHTVGIDTSDLLVVNAGVRGDNDLSWIGNSANLAAKLNSLPSEYPTWITHRVYERLGDTGKVSSKHRTPMWESRRWTSMNNMKIYRSNWSWVI
ncbi:adenylate/guanylate cyclase domain-containing protein [Shimia sp. R11_0]|uniref:adenylate/guanylate cyclase domain-containing protein n=1 Tax=Shimia sp. R11_0 TaxID=2821096 RepID=UPI001ADB383E|nr:adenylate/guanylate cyclase domain-containing protein [Shimia sp. R11_0]MBO9479667.1 adenylate/guanylate cyclase domain-containing protein [Shimia sp. R11_0]